MDHRNRAYYAYLQSPAWRQYRRTVVARDGYRCTRCGQRGRLDVHHLTYARFGHERLEDCISLCRGCHDQAHGRQGTPKAPASRLVWLPLLVVLLLVFLLLFFQHHP